MNHENYYNNICLSIVKFARDFQAAKFSASTYVDWDAHAEVNELPTGDLIGPAGIGLSTEQVNFDYVVFAFGISTIDDPNLFRLRKTMSQLHAKLRPMTKIPIYDADTAQVISWMVVKTPLSISPVSKAELRAVQFINVMALIGPDAQA